jgi:hypothetical protein
MKEAAYPAWAMGFATKLLAYDEAEGCGSRVAKTAYELFQKRRQMGLPGTPDDDWKEAENIVRLRFAREAARRLA